MTTAKTGSRDTRQRGFSLTELMVVVLLAAIIASMSAGMVAAKSDSRDLDGFARAIANAVTVARRRAVATGTPYLVDVRPGSVGYCQVTAALTETACPGVVDSPRGFGARQGARAVAFAADVDLGQGVARRAIGGGARLYVMPNGSCKSAPDSDVPIGLTVYLQSTVNLRRKRTIAVFPAATRPRITDRW